MAKKQSKPANPVENLDPVAVIDATTTKSDRKSGANLVQQSINEESESKKENSKSFIFSQLLSYFFGFNENEEIEKLTAAVEAGFITSEEIPAIVAKRKKYSIESANTCTIDTFFEKLQGFSRYTDLIIACGFSHSTVAHIKGQVTENGKAVIYHSITEDSEINPDSKKATFETATYSSKDYFGNEQTATVWIEKAEITTENLIRAIRYYSVWDSAKNRVNNAIKRENKPVFNFRAAASELLAKGITKEQLTDIISKL